MYRLFIFKQYNAEIFVLLFDPTPPFDPPIRLYLLAIRLFNHTERVKDFETLPVII